MIDFNAYETIASYGDVYAEVADVAVALHTHETVEEAVKSLYLSDPDTIHRTCAALGYDVPDDAYDPDFDPEAWAAKVPLTVETMMTVALS